MHIPHLNHLNELVEGRCHTLNHKTESLPPSNPLVERGRLLGHIELNYGECLHVAHGIMLNTVSKGLTEANIAQVWESG